MKTVVEEGRRVVRCQYCGKNLWPLRGLFDEDFCSRDHRQRYHERVRKALEHLPKTTVTSQPREIAGFQFEKPRPQEPAVMPHRTGVPCSNPSVTAVPQFAHANASLAPAATSFSFAALTPTAGNSSRAAVAAASAIAPNVMSIDSLRTRFQQNHGALAVAMVDAPAGIAPRPGNMALKKLQRWTANPTAFDELNHVYLHEPDPVLEASLPVGISLLTQLKPVSRTARARHTAAAGPSGTGRLEFFPMQPRSAAMPAHARAKEALPEMAFHAGENLWLEDPMSWQVPVSLAPTRSLITMLPEAGRAAALEQFAGAQPASSASTAPLEWRFEAAGVERKPFRAAGPGLASAMVIEFPAPREGASAPLSDEVAIFDGATFGLLLPEIAVQAGEPEIAATNPANFASLGIGPQAKGRAAKPVSDEVAIFDAATFRLLLPEIAVETGDLDILTDIHADIAPAHSDAFGPQTKIGETLLPRGTGWFPIETEAVLPSRSAELGRALAEPKLGANLTAKPGAPEARNTTQSVEAGLPISMPNRAVSLKHGPEFFAAEPVIADSVTRPVSARPQAAALRLTMPEIEIAASDPLFEAVSTQTFLPTGALAGEVALEHEAQAIETAGIEMPAIELGPSGFRTDELKKINVWTRDASDRAPRQFGWMDPQFTLCLPESHYEDYPLALQVTVPEPRTVTVFETAVYNQQSNVIAMNESRPKRFAVPSYIKGMAAGVMLASFLWFGSSSIRSDGITLRPGDLIRLTIQRRAVYEVGDNFHAGLASWENKSNKSWAYDKEGFIRPGRLALYKPSHDMSDYKLEFLTQIERKSVGWVFRAADEQNYYGMKLAVTEPGPRPLVALVRYAVIDGKKESHGETPVQVMMHNNRPYRVEVDVRGSRFLTSIEGQVVDSWSDDRLKTGGVGFFTEGSEKARLYWMKLTKNSDFLGKLCSILVPKES